MRTVLSADATQFHATMRKAAMSARAVGEKMGRSMGKATSAMANVARSAGKAAIAVAAVSSAAVAFGVAGLIKSSSVIAANFEQISVTMSNFVGGAENAAEILAEVSSFSTATPFETTGLQETVNLLLGAGIAAEDAVDVMKEIAAVSKDTGQVGELGDALSKGFAKGKFQTEELNKFLERGINLMPELARVTGKSGAELQKAIQAGLKFEDVRSAIAGMSAEGGLFFGMLEKQSTTTSGLVSTLSSNWDEFRTKLGGPINDQLKPLLDFAIEKVQQLTAIAPRIGEALGSVFEKAANLLEAHLGDVDFAEMFSGDKMKRAIAIMAKFAGSAMWDAIRFAFEAGYRLFRALFSFEGLSFIGEGVYNAFKMVGERLADVLVDVFDRVMKEFTSTWDDVAFDYTPEISNGMKFLQELKDEMSTLEFELSPETKALFQEIKDLGKSEFSEYDAEREEQRKRVAADMAAMAAAKKEEERKKSRWGNFGETIDATLAQRKAAEISGNATDMVGHHNAGFSGLAERSRMQVNSLTGIGVGTTTKFAQDRARLGSGAIGRTMLNGNVSRMGAIGQSSTSGGIGAKRAVGRGKDEAEMKRQAELAKSSEEHLMEIKETIGKSLSVS